jgi:hypothetical protein
MGLFNRRPCMEKKVKEKVISKQRKLKESRTVRGLVDLAELSVPSSSPLPLLHSHSRVQPV